MSDNKQTTSVFKNASSYTLGALKWLLISVLVGLICGLFGVALHELVDHSSALFNEHWWLLFLLPAAGLLIVLLYKLSRIDLSVGTDDVFRAVKDGKPVSPWLTPIILITTALTHLTGGSAGREGAALQIGGSAAAFLGKIMRLSDEDKRIITLCGMSAVFSAAFGTPIAAAVFCVEVVNVGSMRSSALMPCTISSFAAFITAQLLGAAPLRLTVPALAFGTIPALQALAAGILCALLSLLLCRVLHDSKKYFKKFIPNVYIRIVIGGVVVILLTLLLGNKSYNGAGVNLIRLAAENGQSAPYDFVLKLLFTAITLGAGYRGGEIIPTLTIGATFGAFLGTLIGMDPAVCALICMTALFCGATNCPLASILIGFEIAGGANVPFIAIACVVSFMLSGQSSLYTAQEFMFKKLERGIHVVEKKDKKLERPSMNTEE